jgi:3'-5' exoribonuclease
MLHLSANDKLENQPVVVRQITKKVGQNNREYYHLQVSFGIKNYDAKIWSNNEEIAREIIPGCIASITGTAKDFKGILQIHIDKIHRIPNPDQSLIEELTPTCELDEAVLAQDLYKIIDTVENQKLNSLLKLVFESTIVKNNFYKGCRSRNTSCIFGRPGTAYN